MWKFEIKDDWNKIWEVEYIDHWNALLDTSPTSHVFFHPSLVHSWIKAYQPLRNISPIFIHGATEDCNEVFLPLIYWRKNWKNSFIHTIVPAGYSDYDYHDPIFKRIPTDMNVFWDELCQLLWERYPSADKIEITGISPKIAGVANTWRKDEICPSLSLDHIRNMEDLMSFLRPSLRGDIRRQIRRLNQLGQLHLKEYRSYEEIKSTYKDFMTQHAQRWPQAYKAPRFHELLLSDSMLNKCVHFSSLNIDSTPLAWHLGFSFQDVYYYYMPAGDQKYASYSPVKVHLFYLIDRAVSQGYRLYDHLRGEETYKSGWSDGCKTIKNLVLDNGRMISQLKNALLKLR